MEQEAVLRGTRHSPRVRRQVTKLEQIQMPRRAVRIRDVVPNRGTQSYYDEA